MPPRSQRTWLGRAERQSWNVDELRDAIRNAIEQGEIEGTGEAGERTSLADVARRVWSHSQRDGDVYRVPVEDMLALARAIGAAT